MQLIRPSGAAQKRGASLLSFRSSFVASFRCFDCSSGEATGGGRPCLSRRGFARGVEMRSSVSSSFSADPLMFTLFEKLEIQSGETHGKRRRQRRRAGGLASAAFAAAAVQT